MRSFLVWMEASALGVMVRDSGVWTYAFLNLFHILGVATLFGSIVVLDLRLLGWGRRLPVADLSRSTIPLAKVGFTLAAATGVMMLCTNATEYIDNPFLPIKFAAIGVGLANVAIVSRLQAWRALGVRELSASEHRALAIAGGTSLATWLIAVASGRMIGYW
jgi:hypothetical protein